MILPPPWPAAVALAVALGIFWLGSKLAEGLRTTQRPSELDIVAGFVLVTASVAGVVHILALVGIANLSVLRVIGFGLGVSSLGLLSSARRVPGRFILMIRSSFEEATWLERWAFFASGVATLGLVMASLGPPTDADSLGYHLFVPLDWLTHGGARAMPDFLHARLIGLGESMNMLGLAMGTDCLGSVLQAAGLVAAIVTLLSVAYTRADRAFAIALVASCPLLPLMVLSSKPQLMPAAATSAALALVLIHRRSAFRQVDIGTLWLIFGCLNFALACKYSFIPAAAAVATLLLSSLWATSRRRPALVVGLSTFVVIALPVYVRNFLFYGDPLSPVLESFRPHGDPVVRAFSAYLRDFGGDHSFRNVLRAPWALVVATKPWQLTSVLGVGALAALASITRKNLNWEILVPAATVSLVLVAFGQLQARFFFEPYLWFGLSAVLAPWGLRKRLLFAMLSLQLVLSAAVATYGVANFLPAALNAEQRDQLMTNMAPDYALSKWLDQVLPTDAVVATDRASVLFMPRPVMPVDLMQIANLSPLSQTAARARIKGALMDHGVTTLLVTSPSESSPYDWLVAELTAPTHVSPSFSDAARNPWKRGPPYSVLIYDLRKANFAGLVAR